MKSNKIRTWIDADCGGGGGSDVDRAIQEFKSRHGRNPTGRELDALIG